MKFFVTGATGFLGGRLVRQLRQAGHDVVALVRDPSKAAALESSGLQLVKGDLDDRDALRRGMSGVDGLFHLAAWYRLGARDDREARRANVEGTRNVLEAMKETGVPRGVYTSTLAVNSDTHGRLADESYRFDGEHLSIYDRTKAEAHYDVAIPMMEAGLPLVIVQPGVVYGPDDPSSIGKAFRQYLRRRLPAIPRGSAYSWAHVDDVALAHRLAMETGRPGESYIVCGEPKSLEEALLLAEKITGIRAPRLRATPAMLRAGAFFSGLVEKLVPLPEDMTSEYLRVSAGATYLGDNAKARRELGYAPRPLAEGLPEVLRYEMKKLGLGG